MILLIKNNGIQFVDLSFFPSCPIILSSVTPGGPYCVIQCLIYLGSFNQRPVLRRRLSCRTGTSVSCSIGCDDICQMSKDQFIRAMYPFAQMICDLTTVLVR